MAKWKSIAVIGLAGFVLGACSSGDDEGSASSISQEQSIEETSSVVEEQVSEETVEEITAEDFVKEHKRANIDEVIADFNALTDENMKQQLTESVADSKSTMFGQTVVVTGTAVEWHEGAEGMSKGSFIVETDGGNRVRIHAKSPNEALDIGEKVEVKNGTLATPLNSDDILVRDASVYIQ